VSALGVSVALPRLPAAIALQHLSVARTPSVDDADKGRALDVCIGCVCRVATSPRRHDAFG